MLFLARSTFNAFVVVLFLGSYEVVAADDAYLKMLEGEAEDLNLDQTGQLNKEEENTDKTKKRKTLDSRALWDSAAGSDVLPTGLTEEKFPDFLKKNFYGTYLFYKKLNTIDQRTIYYHYSKNKSADIDAVRKDILSHIKN